MGEQNLPRFKAESAGGEILAAAYEAIGASCDAHFGANSNATPSALFAANNCAASTPSSI